MAESLMRNGHEIVYYTCGGVFDRFCVAMSSNGLSHFSPEEKKRETCVACRRTAQLIRNEFNFHNGSDLSKYIGRERRSYVDELMKNLTRENFIEFQVDGFPLGRGCLLEFILQYKKNSLQFTDAEWLAYKDTLRNTIFSHLAAKKIIEEEKPDFVLMYPTSYSVNLAFARYAESMGIPVYRLYGGSCLPYRHSTLVVDRGVKSVFNQNALRGWAHFRSKPIGRKLVSMVTDHFVELMRGQHFVAYSAAKNIYEAVDIRKRFGIEPSQKILFAVMSSYDERFALETVGLLPEEATLFPSQLEWIQHLIGFSAKRKDVFLIIRVHPRDFPNKREGVLSDNARLLQKVFVDLPSNVAVNWPSDGLSVYDIMEHVDVGVNSWSSVGKEMALLGIPVVTYSEAILGYPGELNFVGLTIEQYEDRLEEALGVGWSPAQIHLVYRWYATEFLRPTIDLGGSAPKLGRPIKLIPRAISKLLRIIDPSFYQRRDCRRRLSNIPSAAVLERVFAERADSVLSIPREDVAFMAVSEEEEAVAIREEMRRLVRFMYGDRIKNKDLGPLGQRLTRYFGVEELDDVSGA